MNYRNENQAQGYEPTFTWQQLQAAVLAEREACAKLCDEMVYLNKKLWDASRPEHCAAAIRARSQHE